MDELSTVASHDGPRGEVLLRRRVTSDGDVEELIVNGVFAMDSADASTERALARLALTSARPVRRVLVGGLGLGYTAAAVLALDPPPAHVDVVEIEECLVDWARSGLTATLAGVVADPRVVLHAADVAAVLDGRNAPPAGPWDAVLLDVDNGPDFLIHAQNADLYGARGLHTAYRRLAPGGVLAIWCQGRAAGLRRALETTAPGRVTEHLLGVRRGGRDLRYAVYTCRAAAEHP